MTLIHNPTAGGGKIDAQALIALVRKAGHDVRYQSRRTKHFSCALAWPSDLIAVAGGDGTIRKVAEHLPEPSSPLAILPAGSANNIATSIGISGSLEHIISTWPAAEQRAMDCWQASGPWGARFLLEGAGLGVIADTIAKLKRQHRKSSISDARAVLQKQARGYGARTLSVKIDGEDIEIECLLLEMVNFSSIGPRLRLAPRADPFDGCLDVIAIADKERGAFQEWLESEEDSEPPGIFRRGRHLKCTWRQGTVRLNDKIWPGATAQGVQEFAIEPLKRVRVLMPA